MKRFGPYLIDGETYRIVRHGPETGPLPGRCRWELWEDYPDGCTPRLECTTSTPNDAPDEQGVDQLLRGEKPKPWEGR